MVTCEITGMQTSKPVKIKIGNSILTVDYSQRHLGQPVEDAPSKQHTFTRRKKVQEREEVVDNFQSLVQKELTKRELNLHQLARMLNIKESTLNKIFTNKLKADIQIAKKLEQYFDITLVETVEAQDVNYEDLMADNESSGTTLGDLIKKE